MKSILTVFALLILGACSNSPDPNFYLLQPTGGAPLNNAQKDLIINIAGVTIPEHLSDHRIITEGQGSQVSVAEFDRWAEPLDSNISAVVAKNLARFLGTDNILSAYSGLPVTPNFTIDINVTQFSIELGNSVKLEVLWALTSTGKEGSVIHSFKSQRNSTGGTYDAAVGDMNILIGELSEEISRAILEAR